MPNKNSILLSAEDVDTLALISIYPDSPRVEELLAMLKEGSEAHKLAKTILARAPLRSRKAADGSIEEAADLFLELAEGRKMERQVQRDRQRDRYASLAQEPHSMFTNQFALASGRTRR